jgi:DMSO reductase anchor subunit
MSQEGDTFATSYMKMFITGPTVAAHIEAATEASCIVITCVLRCAYVVRAALCVLNTLCVLRRACYLHDLLHAGHDLLHDDAFCIIITCVVNALCVPADALCVLVRHARAVALVMLLHDPSRPLWIVCAVSRRVQ